VGIELNHTIVRVHDRHAGAQFLAELLGLPVGAEFGPFVPIELANGVSLDYLTTADVQPQHYAFLVSDDEFDAAFARIEARGVRYYAEPGGGQPGRINHRWGGRGVYFNDPDGHAMELLTRAPDL
jgi:catechol 2,3-dioxygenase-like lactoylglutathione lyase family enzyme